MRIYLWAGLIIGTVAFLCNGPSYVFGDRLWLIAIGQILTGIHASLLIVFAFPEMLRQANLAFPNQEDKINNFCAGIFNSTLGIG